MKIYTRTGDHGETALLGGVRVAKSDARIEAYGTVDELNSCLGLARCEALPSTLEAAVSRIQDELFQVGADLASPWTSGKHEDMRISKVMAGTLETEIDEMDAQLEPLRQFILPGGHRASAILHIARNICRRAERCAVALGPEGCNPEVIRYLNRLSDWIFVAARFVNRMNGIPDVLWKGMTA